MTEVITRRNVLGGIGTIATVAATARNIQAQTTPAPANRLRKIALEEHIIFPDFVEYLAETKQNIRDELFDLVVPVLSDFGEQRLSVMDANGIDFSILSIAGPGVQIEPDTEKATRLAASANDRLAIEVQKQARRYGGLAHLAMQDPAAAANELERCMTELSFQGAMINGATNGVYLDGPEYDVFWERAAALKAPVYIHPGNPTVQPANYSDHPELWGPLWSWGAETCTHALRLIFAGVFDRHPEARVILGHMGETLPIQTWRLDSRYPISRFNNKILRNPSDYLRSNFWFTTSGVCDDVALRCALDNIGKDRILFSIDYPFENSNIASEWIGNADISEEDRRAVAYENSLKLMNIPS